MKLFGWVAMSILGVSPMIAQAPQAPLQQSFWVNPATPHAALKTVSASTKKAASAAKPAAKPAVTTASVVIERLMPLLLVLPAGR